MFLFDRMLDLLSGLGLTGVFVGVFLESIGLPFPGSVLVGFAGFLAKQGEFSIAFAWVASLLGYLLGSISAFLIGRHIGEPFIEKWGKYIRLTPKKIDKAKILLQKSAPAYIIGGRFLPTIGNVTPYVAGISGISAVKFVIFDMIHALLWLTIFLGFGAVIGSEWQSIVNSAWLKWIAIGAGIWFCIYLFRKLLAKQSKDKI